jgi:two-component system chemotaxis response regulator CheY
MGKHVLVVDDSSAVRQSVSYVLGQAGYSITEAEDGSQALEKLEENQPDLIVTDVNMPNLDGIGLVRAIREKAEFKFLPIIMLTTESESSKMEEGKAAGATGWIVKPFDSDKLLAVVKKLAG